MRNKLFVLLAVILVASLVLGCAKPAGEKPSDGEPASSLRDQIIAQAKEEGEIIVVGSKGEDYATKLKGFQEKYPFIKVGGIDLNTAKSVNRAMMEVKAGRVSIDVVEIGDDGLYTLAREGALQKPEVAYPHLKDFDPRLQPSSGLFVSIQISPRNQGSYNTEMVAPDEVPTTWEEMTDPKWKGKTIVSASSEEFPLTLAYLWRKDGELNWERSFAFWEKIFQHEPLVTKGYRRGNEQVSAGERAIFWFTPTEPPTLQHFDGAPIDLLSFGQIPASTRCAGILKGAPHPAAAWLFIDYLTSPEGAFEYSEVKGSEISLKAKANKG